MSPFLIQVKFFTVIFVLISLMSHEAEANKPSVAELQQLAKQGDAEAQVRLGVLYRAGREISQDYGLAQKWFLEAAKQGNADGQNNLGLMYDHGRGVDRDFVQARKWYLKAAQHGHANAQYNLALLYVNGQGIPQDDIEGYVWANIAAAQRPFPLAVELRDRLKKVLGPTCTLKAQTQSKEYFEKYVVPFQ